MTEREPTQEEIHLDDQLRAIAQERIAELLTEIAEQHPGREELVGASLTLHIAEACAGIFGGVCAQQGASKTAGLELLRACRLRMAETFNHVYDGFTAKR